jgi:hypothetical protein
MTLRLLGSAALAVACITACSRPGGPTPDVEPVAVRSEPEREAPQAATTTTTEVHGALTIRGGQTVLQVWGTPKQMGHAHGVLLRDAILDVVEHYALDVVPPAQLAAAGAMLATVAEIPEPLVEEAEGIVAGMREAGGAYVAALDRELTTADLLALNTMTDLVAIGCSSVSAWGEGVVHDEDGAPMVVRNLDWSNDRELLRQQIVLVTMPDDPARQPLVSIGFAGYIACLSCVNEAGVTALFNMGYGDGVGTLATAARGFAPANLLLRDALSRRDVDGDGKSTGDDVEAAIAEAKHTGSYIVHVVEPTDEAPARVLEVESDGYAVRRADDSLAGSHLAATNHLRAKAAPTSCSRYRDVAKTSRAVRRFSEEDLWALGRTLRLPEVVHSILVEPKARAFSLWMRKPGEAAASTAAPVRHEWSSLVARE